MKTLFALTVCAIVGLAAESQAASCDVIPANSHLPININGYTISHATPGTTTTSDQNGSIPLNGGLSINFEQEHVGTILEFLGGSVGDVDPFITLGATGGVVATSGIAVPKTVGVSVKSAVYTRGVTMLHLISQNNEGLLASICSAD